jgi:hypothetical protein
MPKDRHIIQFRAPRRREYARAARAEGMTLSQWLRRLADPALEGSERERARDEVMRRALEIEGSLSEAEAEDLMRAVREGRGRDPWSSRPAIAGSIT